jgi:triacylglycerol esterase/lipase EstA (alpha/beta hydrolase family)
MLTYDRRSHHPATRIMFLYWHMTGEVIIQLPGYCLYTVIWQEKSSSSYPDNVSILTYDRRSHNPATRILSLYWHMTGEVIIQLPGSCLYSAIWLEKSSPSYPDHVSILSYDRRSHHPATRIMFLCWHMTGEVIIQLPGYCLYTDIWQEKSSSSYPDNVSILTSV